MKPENSSSSFVFKLREQIQQSSARERRIGAEAYMRNQFIFIGVDTATRRQVFKLFLANNQKPPYEELATVINEMWLSERELQYCAIELGALYKKQWQLSFIETIEACIVAKSWWDTIDHIASEWTGPYFRLFPDLVKPVTGRWNRSENIWLQRSSLLFQKKYKLQTDTKLFAKYILNCAASNEFFIQKGIGWALREYAKTNPGWVKAFVVNHTLKPLSRREALKNL